MIVIQDGVGDRPVRALGGKTPLEAARTPAMDFLIRRGSAGLMDILGPGIVVGTDIGHLALFGQDTSRQTYRRGPMEAIGAGVDLDPHEIAIRFNFATLDDAGEIVDRRAGRIREEAAELVKSLNRMQIDESHRVRFIQTTEHRGVLVLEGPDLSSAVSDTDPGGHSTTRRILPSFPLEETADAHRTAALLNRIVRESQVLLQQHPTNHRRVLDGKLPANAILTRGAGTRQKLANLPGRLGLGIACVSGEATVLGLARLAGIDPITSEKMTSNLDTDFVEKEQRTLEALESHDIVYLHLKGCDIAGHDLQPRLKKEFIEQTDEMTARILKRLPAEDTYFAFLGDHATPSELGEHSGDPVPVFLAGPDIPADAVEQYGESCCARGRLGRILCRDLLNRLFDVLTAEAVDN